MNTVICIIAGRAAPRPESRLDPLWTRREAPSSPRISYHPVTEGLER